MKKRFLGGWLLFSLMLGLIFALPDQAYARKHKSGHATSESRARSGKAKTTKRTQQARSRHGKRVAKTRKGKAQVARHRNGLPASAIPPERVTEIQSALKREGYLQNEPNGQYDRATVDAMTNYQRDHNFRTTGYPTAESLQKLGLTRQRRVNPPVTPGGENRPDDSSQTSPHLSNQQN